MLLLLASLVSFECRQTKATTTPLDKPELKDNATPTTDTSNKWFGDEPTSYFRDNSLADSFDQTATFDQYISYAMQALHLVAGYDNDLHRYDNQQDLINSIKWNSSFSSEDEFQRTSAQQQARCGTHLRALLAEARKLFASSHSFSNSRQLKLIEFFDSFGAPEAQLIKGNTMWLGSHEQCSNSRFKLVTEMQSGRYCIANFRSSGWAAADVASQLTEDQQLGSQSIKLGVCLPEDCNTISYLHHADLIESLAKQVRLSQVPYSSYKLTHLYCLPDESSALRQFSWSARIFIVSLLAWLSIVAYHSLKYERLRLKWLSTGEPAAPAKQTTRQMQIFAFRLSWNNLFCNSSIADRVDAGKIKVKIVKKLGEVSTDSDQESGIEGSDTDSSFSISSVATNQKQANIIKVLEDDTGKTSLASAVVVVSQNHNNLPISSEKSNGQPRNSKVDLNAIDGIKVLSMIWLISGHTLLFFIRTIANGRDFWSVLRDARFMTIMAGIFPVDTFFTITGILTAYLKFNKNPHDLKSPRYWMEAFVHRYLRFMPMYLFVFWYTRDVSEYIGAGPLWDYATANTSLRSMCKQESALVPILFQANFKSIDQHCVKPAWYLANDYQFLLVTPLFMGLIIKSKWLGYSVIGLSVALSLMLQFLTVFYSRDMEDFGALINFKPMFGTYVLRNLWKLYVLPYNRVPPYLMGIITGHLMYLSQSKAQTEGLTLASQEQKVVMSDNNLTQTTAKSEWKALREYICTRIWTPLIFLVSIIYLPQITKISTQEGLPAKIGTSSIMALMRFVWSLSIARLIYICATRHLANETKPERSDNSFVIRFLSSKKWAPWSKIGLSALLIQWEIISYLAQTQTSAPNITITFLLATVLICIVITYSLALLIYLTIEYPLSQIEYLYIRPALFKQKGCSTNSSSNCTKTT